MNPIVLTGYPVYLRQSPFVSRKLHAGYPFGIEAFIDARPEDIIIFFKEISGDGECITLPPDMNAAGRQMNEGQMKQNMQADD